MSPEARVEDGAIVEGPVLHRRGRRSSRPAPGSARTASIGRQCHIEEHAVVERSIVWANTRISQEAVVRGSILGRHCHIGRNALVDDGVVLGDKSVVTDYSRL